MKKRIALLLTCLLIAATLFAACGQTPATDKVIRWDDSEYSFRISLADFSTAEEDTVFHTYGDYSKDLAISNEVFSTLDEIRPLAVQGTYKFSLHKTSDRWTVETSQTLYAQYERDKVTLSADELAQVSATAEDVAANAPALTDGGGIVLKSVITTGVVFRDISDQTPISSHSEFNGFYIGESNQQLSKYTVSTEYKSDDGDITATVKVDDKDPVDYDLGGTKFIDQNQLLLYVRSLDKSETSFQDSPNVQMFDPLTGEFNTVTFAFVYDSPMIITDPAYTDPETDQHSKRVSLNIVTVTVGGMAYMVQENVPDKVAVDEMKGTGKHLYTTVRFRVGYLAYELNYSDELWNALAESYTTE